MKFTSKKSSSSSAAAAAAAASAATKSLAAAAGASGLATAASKHKAPANHCSLSESDFGSSCVCQKILNPYPPPGSTPQSNFANPYLQHYCRVCNIQLNSCRQSKIHTDGKKHKKRLNYLQLCIKSSKAEFANQTSGSPAAAQAAAAPPAGAQPASVAPAGAFLPPPPPPAAAAAAAAGLFSGIPVYSSFAQYPPAPAAYLYTAGPPPPPPPLHFPAGLSSHPHAQPHPGQQHLPAAFAQLAPDYYSHPQLFQAAHGVAHNGAYLGPANASSVGSQPGHPAVSGAQQQQQQQQQHKVTSPSLTSGFSGSGGDCKSTETSSILSAASYSSSSNLIKSPEMATKSSKLNGAGSSSLSGVAVCDPCHLSFPSQAFLDMHLLTSRHSRRLKTAALGAAMRHGKAKSKGGKTASEMSGRSGAGSCSEEDKKSRLDFAQACNGGEIRCEVCEVSVNSSHQLQAHLAGQKHRVNAVRQGLKADQPVASPSSSTMTSASTSERGFPVAVKSLAGHTRRGSDAHLSGRGRHRSNTMGSGGGAKSLAMISRHLSSSCLNSSLRPAGGGANAGSGSGSSSSSNRPLRKAVSSTTLSKSRSLQLLMLSRNSLHLVPWSNDSGAGSSGDDVGDGDDDDEEEEDAEGDVEEVIDDEEVGLEDKVSKVKVSSSCKRQHFFTSTPAASERSRKKDRATSHESKVSSNPVGQKQCNGSSPRLTSAAAAAAEDGSSSNSRPKSKANAVKKAPPLSCSGPSESKVGLRWKKQQVVGSSSFKEIPMLNMFLQRLNQGSSNSSSTAGKEAAARRGNNSNNNNTTASNTTTTPSAPVKEAEKAEK